MDWSGFRSPIDFLCRGAVETRVLAPEESQSALRLIYPWDILERVEMDACETVETAFELEILLFVGIVGAVDDEAPVAVGAGEAGALEDFEELWRADLKGGDGELALGRGRPEMATRLS